MKEASRNFLRIGIFLEPTRFRGLGLCLVTFWGRDWIPIDNVGTDANSIHEGLKYFTTYCTLLGTIDSTLYRTNFVRRSLPDSQTQTVSHLWKDPSLCRNWSRYTQHRTVHERVRRKPAGPRSRRQPFSPGQPALDLQYHLITQVSSGSGLVLQSF